MNQHTPLTDQQLDQIAARLQAATPGPWGSHRDLNGTYTIQARPQSTRHGFDTDGDIATLAAGRTDAESYANARFIAHAPQDVETLLAEVHRLRDERDELIRQRDQIAMDTLKAITAEEPSTGTRPCGHDDYHDPHEWADRPNVWCPGISHADDEGLSGPCDCGEGAVHYTAADCPFAQRAAAAVSSATENGDQP